MKARRQTKRTAEAARPVDQIDWRALLPRCVELIKPIHDPNGNRSWDSEYRQSTYAAIEHLIPLATVAAYGRADREMADAVNRGEYCQDHHNERHTDESPECHAFDAVQHIFGWRALLDCVSTRQDVFDRLEHAVLLEKEEAFPDGWISWDVFLSGVLADLRSVDAQPVRKAA